MKNNKLFKVTIQLVSFLVIALVAYLIATNSFLAPDDSEASKLETLWMYDFDNLDDWDVVTTDGCIIAPHDMSSLGGSSKGLQISREVATKNCHLEKQIVPSLTRGEIRIEFYDDLDANNPLSTVFAAKDSNNNKTQLGIIAKQNSTEYLYNINGSDISSNVTRTQGWHLFTLKIDNGISYGSIDEVDLTSLPFNTLMTDFDLIKIASGWESKQTINIGSVEVLSKSNTVNPPEITPVPAERPSVMYTLNSTRLTPDQEFDIDITTTVDLQLLDSNELNNLFLNLGELYPDVSNLDYLPMFLVEKDPNGNYLFAGLSWKGTDNLGNPNINQYTSYEISGAKLTSGQDAWICNDTNRKTDFGFRDTTIACLVGSGSSVSQEGDKVAIRWSIRLMPGFFDLREVARGISKNSTNIRDLNVYTTVNRKSTDFTSEDFDFNNEWDKIGNVEVYNSARKNLNVSNFNYDQGSNMINVGLTGIDSSENINRITIWIDEIDPNGIRSDMASTFQFVKEGTEWKAYGRNYTDLRLICTVGQKTFVGADCYRNYKYDFGGYALGSNSEIYYGRNRMSTGNYDANESSSKLSLSSTQITAANNSLSLQLPIEFYEIMMDRNLNMYISWISTDGNNMHWNQVGEMFVESNNSSDLGQVYIDNNQKLRYSGNDEEYTWVGTNDYLLHKYLDERELDAHMAKMHVYGMNYIRIFVEPFYTNPDSVMAFVDKANDHNVYVDLVIFGPCGNLPGVDDDVERGKRWLDFWNDKLADYDNVVSWDLCNDVSPQSIEFVKQMSTYLKQIRGEDTIVTVQLGSSPTLNSFAMEPYSQLVPYIDLYSIRSYSDSYSGMVREVDLWLANVDTYSEEKPVYIGEFGVWGNINTYYTPEDNLRMNSFLDTMYNEYGIKSAHPWQSNFRNGSNYNSTRPFFPNLSPEIWDKYYELNN